MSIIVSVPDHRLADALEPLPSGVELIQWDMSGPAPRDHIDIVVPPYMNAGRVYPLLKGVTTQLVQSQSIGYDGIAEVLPSGHRFANAASVHETSTAELALALALAAQRNIPQYVRDQDAALWHTTFEKSLADQRVLIVGYGGVGKAIAARFAPFEVDIQVVASQAREEDGRHVHGIDELPRLLPETDVLVLALPGGASTHHLIDDAALSLLPDGALIVNIGRGSLIDPDALLAHLNAHRIRAALDVTEPEPLPDGHPLFRAPGILISPHVGGATTAMLPRMVKLIRRQIDLMLAGDDPINIVIDA